MTQRNRVLIAVYTAFLVYFTLNMSMGANGITEYRRLVEYNKILTKNLKELESLNLGLQEKAAVLRTEPDTLIVYSRNLDYYNGNEGVIILKGYERKQSSYPMGKMLSWTHVPENKTPLFRTLALLMGLAAYLLLFFLFRQTKNQ